MILISTGVFFAVFLLRSNLFQLTVDRIVKLNCPFLSLGLSNLIKSVGFCERLRAPAGGLEGGAERGQPKTVRNENLGIRVFASGVDVVRCCQTDCNWPF